MLLLLPHQTDAPQGAFSSHSASPSWLRFLRGPECNVCGLLVCEFFVATTAFVPNSLLVIGFGIALHFFSRSVPKRQELPGVPISLSCSLCEREPRLAGDSRHERSTVPLGSWDFPRVCGIVGWCRRRLLHRERFHCWGFKPSFVALASWTVVTLLQGFERAVPPTTSSAAATYRLCASAGGGPQKRRQRGTSRKVCVAELSNLAQQVFHTTAAALLARLPCLQRVVEVRV